MEISDKVKKAGRFKEESRGVNTIEAAFFSYGVDQD
jgi:hypothetical protein